MKRFFTIVPLLLLVGTAWAQQIAISDKLPLPYRQAWTDFEAGYDAFYRQNYTAALEKFNACVKTCDMLNRNRAFNSLRKNIDYMLNDMQRAIENAQKLKEKFGDAKLPVQRAASTGAKTTKAQAPTKEALKPKTKTEKPAEKKSAAAAPPPANIAALEDKLKGAGGAKDADAAAQLAELYLQANDLKNAEKWARQAASWNRKHFKARFVLASVYMKAAESSADETEKERKKSRAKTNLKLARIYCTNEEEKAMVEDALEKLGK